MSYLTRQQAMDYLGIKNAKMWRLTTQRKIPFYQDGPNGKMLFSQADLDRYMESIKVAAAPPVSAYGTYRKVRSSKRVSA